MSTERLKAQRSRTTKSRSNDWTAEQRAQIARLAYDRYLARGGESGRDLDDWLEAEAQFAATQKAARPRRPRAVKEFAVPASESA